MIKLNGAHNFLVITWKIGYNNSITFINYKKMYNLKVLLRKLVKCANGA